MAEQFEFNAWCTENELETETVDLLKAKGFKSYRSLVRLTNETIKKEIAKGVTPGQLALLEGGLEILHPPKEPTNQPSQRTDDATQAADNSRPPASDGSGNNINPPPGFPALPPGGQQLSPSDLLAMWAKAGESLQPPTTEGNANITPDDPFGFGMGPFGSKKCRQVGEYITHLNAIEAEENDTTVNLGGVEFSLAKGKKVAQDKIKMPHFMEGSLRILRELIVEEGLPTTQIINHINYLIQIACLAQTNIWKKVKDYDYIYRREQSKQGFAWGKSSSFLLQSQLGPSHTELSNPLHI